MKKYEFTKETRLISDQTVYRIKALKDFGDVKAGDLGGFIEREENLSHEGTCWVAGNAIVHDNAVVRDNAVVCGSAIVRDSAVVCDDAIVCGDSGVFGWSCIQEHASIYDNATIYDKVAVKGHSTIKGTAVVCGCILLNNMYVADNAKLCDHNFIALSDCMIRGNAEILSVDDVVIVSLVGSQNGNLTAYRTKDGGIEVTRGCFVGGLDKFGAKVMWAHCDNFQVQQEYLALIEFIKIRLNRKHSKPWEVAK